jgi:hypothetical protein
VDECNQRVPFEEEHGEDAREDDDAASQHLEHAGVGVLPAKKKGLWEEHQSHQAGDTTTIRRGPTYEQTNAAQRGANNVEAARQEEVEWRIPGVLLW